MAATCSFAQVKGRYWSGRYGFEAVALVLFVALLRRTARATCSRARLGIQNASLTRVRGTRIRTTHVTSVWTDAGDDSGDRRARGAPGVSASRAGDLTVASRLIRAGRAG